MSGKTIFITGVTGYIGGTVLQSIITSKNPPSKIIGLIRDSTKINLFTNLELARQHNVTLVPLLGSLEEHDKIRDAAFEADVVVSCANADDLKGVQAMLEGMRRRKEKTGHRPHLIHTSGTGVLVDDARGEYPTDTIYTDLNPSPATRVSPALHSVTEIPVTNPHRNVDLEIVQADQAGVIKSYIVLPSTIWGCGQGEVYEKSLSHATSQQMPLLIEIAIKRKRAGVVGKGQCANIWPHISIVDLGHLYRLVWEQSTVTKPVIGHGPAGYYFGISGEYTLLGATSAIGQSLAKYGALPKGTETSPTTFTKEEIDLYFGGSWFSGTNSRGVADRSKSIGWNPKYTDEEQFFEDIDQEAKRISQALLKQ
nr:NAD dependent epimerase/dehydratase [Cryptococcus depauperatus CBS 7841]